MQKIEELYQLYFRDVYRFLLVLSRNEDIAEEITQETFFKALKSVSKFRGDCDVRVWLCQIAKNTFYSYQKKNRYIDFGEMDENTPDESVSVEAAFSDKEQAEQIKSILEIMDEPYKGVFHLRVFSELSFRQIGKAYGKTESWARVTYHRAKCKIVERMENEYEK